MLSNTSFLAKFRFDTAENVPAKNLQILQKKLLILLGRERRGSAGRESIIPGAERTKRRVLITGEGDCEAVAKLLAEPWELSVVN